MAYIRPDSAGKRDESPHPVSRPAPALKNKPAPKKKKANPNRTLTPRQESLEKAFGGKYKAQTGHDLRSNPGLLRALLESNVADVAAARDVMASDRVKVEHIPPIHDQDFANQFVVQLRKNGMTPLSIAMIGGKLSKSGRARDAGFLQTAQNQIDAFEALSRKQGPGREVEKGLEGDAVAEAVLGGLAGGLVAGGVKAVGGAAAKKAAGGLLGADALEGGAAALRFTTPTKGILKHIVPNRPSVARPLADFAGRSGAHRIAAGSGILAAAPLADKAASAGKKKADEMRAAGLHIEVDKSELNLDAQAVAAGEKPPAEKNLEGLRNGPGRLGLSPSLRRRLLHQARVNGWPVPDSVNDTELVAKAYKRNLTPEQRLSAGLVENAGTLAFVPAFAGAVYDATKRTSSGGEGAKPWVEIAEGMANATANAAHHPLDNPLFFASILSAGVKGVGRGSAKLLGVKEAPLKFKVGDVKGNPYEWRYGTAKANTLTRPAALLGQKILNSRRAAGLQDTIMAKQGGRAAETAIARATARGGTATHDLSKALNKLGKKDQVLAVHSHLTGSSAKNQAAYYATQLAKLETRPGYTVDKGRFLRAKVEEWTQLAKHEANLSPATQRKIVAFGEEAARVESVNQAILGDFGMSPEVMRQRLWMQALEQHPTLKSTLKDIKVETRKQASDQLAEMRGHLESSEKVTGALTRESSKQQRRADAGSETAMVAAKRDASTAHRARVAEAEDFLRSSERTAANLYKEAGKWQRQADAIKGKTAASTKRKALFEERADKAFEMASRVQRSANMHSERAQAIRRGGSTDPEFPTPAQVAQHEAQAGHAEALAGRTRESVDAHNARIREFKKAKPYKEKRRRLIAEAEEAARVALAAAGHEPKMWVPHVPADSGPVTFISAENPFITKGADRLTNRFKKNTGATLQQGLVDERPSLTVAAAAKPSQVKSMVDDMERFLEQKAVPLDVANDRGLRVDADRFVYIRASKDGKLSRSAVMRRGQDQARLLEESGLGNEGAINDLMSSIFDVVQPKDGRVPTGKYYVIPRAVQEQIVQNARTEAVRRGLAPGLRKVAQTSTSLMINTLPRTVFNNLAGGIPMSTLGGAGPLAHARYLRDPEFRALTPPELQGRGTAGAQTKKLAAKEGNPILRPWRSHTQRMRSYNVAVEDFPRGTLAVKNLLKEAKDVQYGNRIIAGMHRVDQETKNIAKGLYDTHPERYERAVQKTVDWVGDLGHLSKLDPAMQIAVPFWRWTKHILKSTLYTMPKKYPGRAILLQAMGEVGREYQREHGIWPSWIQGAIDLGDEIPLLGGVKGEVTSTLNSSGAWPYSTQTQVIAPAFDNAGIDPLAPIGNVSPVISLLPALGGANLERMDKLKDSEGRPIEVGTPEWRRLVLAKFLEFAPTPYSRSGQENTSLPWDTQYKDNGLPRRPNDALNIFLRGIGVPITPVLTGGPELKKQGTKAFKRAKSSFGGMPLEEKQAMAKAWRQNDDGSYSTIIDLGHGH